MGTRADHSALNGFGRGVRLGDTPREVRLGGPPIEWPGALRLTLGSGLFYNHFSRTRMLAGRERRFPSVEGCLLRHSYQLSWWFGINSEQRSELRCPPGYR